MIQSIHLAAFRQRLGQRHRVRQFRFLRREHLDFDLRPLAVQVFQRGVVFAALAVEQGDLVARRQPQHMQVMRDMIGQGNDGAFGQGIGKIEAGHGRSVRVGG
jgi:hypothetical protein